MNNKIQQLEQLLRDLRYMEESSPSASFKANARIRILNVLQSPDHQPYIRNRTSFFPALLYRVVFLIIVLTAGTVFAAQSSQPGTILFPVKVLSERAALLFAPTQGMKTDIAGEIINRRITEVEKAKSEGHTDLIEESMRNYETSLTEIQKSSHISTDEIENDETDMTPDTSDIIQELSVTPALNNPLEPRTPIPEQSDDD